MWQSYIGYVPLQGIPSNRQLRRKNRLPSEDSKSSIFYTARDYKATHFFLRLIGNSKVLEFGLIGNSKVLKFRLIGNSKILEFRLIGNSKVLEFRLIGNFLTSVDFLSLTSVDFLSLKSVDFLSLT